MIFPALWHALPGPVWARLVVLLVASALVVWVLFEFVFPWVSVTFDIQDQSVEE